MIAVGSKLGSTTVFAMMPTPSLPKPKENPYDGGNDDVH